MNWNSETKTTPHSDTNTKKEEKKNRIKRRKNNQFRPYRFCLCIMCCVWIYFLLVLNAHWLLQYRLPYIYRCVVVSLYICMIIAAQHLTVVVNFFIHLQTVWLWVVKKQKWKILFYKNMKKNYRYFPQNFSMCACCILPAFSRAFILFLIWR